MKVIGNQKSTETVTNRLQNTFFYVPKNYVLKLHEGE